MPLYCSFDMHRSFILGLHILVSGAGKFAFGDYILPIIILLTPFLINWPLKQVFRGHFGPQVKFLAETLVVRIEIEIAVCVGGLSVDIHFKLRAPPCDDSV